jgi:hypothetical protein
VVHFITKEVAAMHTNVKLFVAIVAGLTIALAIPTPKTVYPPVWRDDYVHEPGWTHKAKNPLKGIATWYDATKNDAWYTQPNKWGKTVKHYVAAGPMLRRFVKQRWMMEPVAIWITSKLTGVTVKAYVVDWCGCWGRKSDPDDTRLADFAPAIWDALGVPLERGVTRVEISLVKP